VRRALAAAATLTLSVTLSATPARAADPAITLSASSATVVFGEEVTLSGEVTPAAAGETVEVRDDADQVVTTSTTGATGSFSSTVVPTATVTLHAVWGATVSAPVTVEVRAVVHVALPPVRLFDEITVRGTVAPAVPGQTAVVELTKGGSVITTRHARIGRAGGFDATFPIETPGRYRARAWFSDATHLKDGDVSDPRSTPLPSLSEGSHGPFVELLERRLAALHYRVVRIDQRFDFRTADAVLAFRKVQGMARVLTVEASTWRALADPEAPRARSRGDGFHIEVDQTRQVLYAVQDGDITDILHISSGKPSTPTRDGTFHVIRKVAGFSPNHLYYPSYFDGYRALHGWTEVPTYPASHGCVRIPYWNALFVYAVAKIGTPVLVYHS
jgi:N-acetylmuramoyl-L-alanine amidase